MTSVLSSEIPRIHLGDGVKELGLYIWEIFFFYCVFCVCLPMVCACEYRHPWCSEALDFLELELAEVRNDLMWMLGTKLWSPGAAASVHSSEPSVQPLGFTFSFYCKIYLLSTGHSGSS